MSLLHRMNTLAAASLLLASTPSLGADALFPAVPGYGGIHPLMHAVEQPDKKLRYKLVFDITQAASDPAKPNPSLDKVARLLNLLAYGGVKPKPGDVIAIVHDKATPLILKDERYQEKNQVANPNLALIAQLRAAGAEVHICSQAMYGMNIPAEDVDPRIQIDMAALTTLANLQLRGYALIPD